MLLTQTKKNNIERDLFTIFNYIFKTWNAFLNLNFLFFLNNLLILFFFLILDLLSHLEALIKQIAYFTRINLFLLKNKIKF